MDTPSDPDERARTYARYKKAHVTQKQLKPLIDAMAAEDLEAGKTIAQLAELTGIGEEVFRRKARAADLPVDPRYAERAEAIRKRRTAKPAERVSPLAAHQAKLIATLTNEQAAQLATRAFAAADRRQYSELNEASTDGDRAVVTAALANGTIGETDLRLA